MFLSVSKNLLNNQIVNQMINLKKRWLRLYIAPYYKITAMPLSSARTDLEGNLIHKR